VHRGGSACATLHLRPPDGDRCWIALSDSELLVLSYLPINLGVAEIACELYVSPNTVKTTFATCTPSSARITGPKPSRPPASLAYSHPPVPAERNLVEGVLT
jgi:hypothetical protein